MKKKGSTTRHRPVPRTSASSRPHTCIPSLPEICFIYLSWADLAPHLRLLRTPGRSFRARSLDAYCSVWGGAVPVMKRQRRPLLQSISFSPIFRLHAPFFFSHPQLLFNSSPPSLIPFLPRNKDLSPWCSPLSSPSLPSLPPRPPPS